MAKVELIAEGMPNLVPMQGRSEGVHVSHLIHRLSLKRGDYPERVDDGTDTRDNTAIMELGNCFEHALKQRLAIEHPDEFIEPSELEFDGLFGTPDLLHPALMQDHEIKCTYMSAGKWGPGSQKFWKYETQLKAYLYMLSRGGKGKWWCVGCLHVLFINGNYSWKKDGGGPIYRVWKYEFTQLELEANWKTLKEEEQALTLEAQAGVN